jgi:transposase
LIKETVQLQGFGVVAVEKVADGLEAKLAPDRRFAPLYGACGHRARYRDSRPVRRFWHVPLWGIDVHLVYAPRRVRCRRCGGVPVEALPWVVGKRRFTRDLMVTLATGARVLT